MMFLLVYEEIHMSQHLHLTQMEDSQDSSVTSVDHSHNVRDSQLKN